MKSIVLFTLPVAIILSSCAGDSGSKGKDAEGNCTQETVSVYNDVNHKAKMYDLTRNRDYVIGAKNACTKLQSLVGTSSCKAENMTSGEVMAVSYNNVQTTCENVEKILNPPKVQQPLVPVTVPTKPTMPDVPNPAPVDVKIVLDEELRHGLALTVNYEITLNSIINKDLIIANGYLDHENLMLQKAKYYCSLKSEVGIEYKVGEKLTYLVSLEKNGQLKLETFDRSRSIICTNTSTALWRLKNLQVIFGDLVKFESLPPYILE